MINPYQTVFSNLPFIDEEEFYHDRKFNFTHTLNFVCFHEEIDFTCRKQKKLLNELILQNLICF